MKKALLTTLLLTTIFTIGLTQKQSNEQKVAKFKMTYVNSLKKCISIANEIIQLDDATIISQKRDTAKTLQAKAYNAFMLLQDPDLKFPYEKIKSMLKTNPIFFGEGVFSDERFLKLPAKEYKAKVQEQIEVINSALPIIDKF